MSAADVRRQFAFKGDFVERTQAAIGAAGETARAG
jgi:hypothetical protein